MTLKEKFERYVLEKDFFGDNVQEKYTVECEKIADDYAIELLEWLTNKKSKFSIMYGNQEKRFSTIEEDYTTKELLEMFKKEKGL